MIAKLDPTPESLTLMRNMLACQLESARSVAAAAPFGADMILGLAVRGMLQVHFWQARHTLPHEAEFLTALTALDHHLGHLAQRFEAETDLGVRWSLAEQIADHTIQVRKCIQESSLATVV